MFNRRKNTFTINLKSLSPAELALGAGQLTLAAQNSASLVARRCGFAFIRELERSLNGSSSNGLHDIRFDDLDTQDLITARAMFIVLTEGNQTGLKSIFSEILARLSDDMQRPAAS